MRKFILEKTTLQSYIDFNGEQVFESATVDTSITTFLKLPPTPSHQVAYLSCVDSSTLSSLKSDSIPQSSLSTQTLTFSSSSVMALKEKIESIGTPLKEWDISIFRGVLTGYNEAFIITTEKREEILRNCKTQEEREATEQIIKKILRGRDIERYSYEWADLWLIFIPWHFPNIQNPKTFEENEKDFKTQYPSLYSHFLTHKEKLSARNQSETGIRYEWYCMQRWASNYYQEFDKAKLLYNDIAIKLSFAYDKGGAYCNNTVYFLSANNTYQNLFLNGVLNSNSINWFYRQISAQLGNSVRMFSHYMEKLPIPKITESNQSTADKIIALVERILEQKEQNPSSSTQELESQIDSLVYTLYNLTDEEIKIIENKE